MLDREIFEQLAKSDCWTNGFSETLKVYLRSQGVECNWVRMHMPFMVFGAEDYDAIKECFPEGRLRQEYFLYDGDYETFEVNVFDI